MLLFPNSKLSTNKPPSNFRWKFTGHLDRTHIAPFPFKIKVEWLRSLPSWCFIPCGFLYHRFRNSMVSRGLGDKCSLVVYWNSSFFVHSSIFDSVRRLSFWHSMRSGWGENKCEENGSTDIAVCFTILKRMLEEPPKPFHLKSHSPCDPNYGRSSAGSGASPRILSASSSAIMIVGLPPWTRIIHAILHSNLLNLTTVMYNVIVQPSLDTYGDRSFLNTFQMWKFDSDVTAWSANFEPRYALRLPLVIEGIIEASATRRFSTPVSQRP